MLNINEINNEIAKLENGNTNYNTIEKLSVLYIVRDHFDNPEIQFDNTENRSSNEFVSALIQANSKSAVNILAEHMDVVKMLMPQEYAAVINALRKTKSQD